jgi:ABC-type glycerol-3-phosphate transport system substrate-binding protein
MRGSAAQGVSRPGRWHLRRAATSPLRWIPRTGWLLALLALTLTGCLPGAQQPSTPGDAPPLNPDIPREPVTMEVWLNLDFVTPDPLFRDMIADFERAYPNVTVSLQSAVPESMPGKVRVALQVGAPPDLVQGQVAAMAAQGLAEPLDDLWSEWDAQADFLPEAMGRVTWDGVRYGVPLDIYTLVLLYNKSFFDEAGLDYPNTSYDWRQFGTDAATLTRPSLGRYGLGFTVEPWYVFGWLAEAGGDLLSGDSFLGYRFTLDSGNNVEGLRFLTTMARNGYGPLPTARPRDYEDPRKLFLKGQIAMFFGTPGDVHYIRSQSPDFPIGVAELPKTPAGASAASALGGTGLFVPRGSRHREIAFEFMKWATSDRYALTMARRLGRYPARAWLETTPHFAGDPLLKPFLLQLNAARPDRLDAFPEAERAYADAIKAAFYGADPAEALHEAQKQANAALGQSVAAR